MRPVERPIGSETLSSGKRCALVHSSIPFALITPNLCLMEFFSINLSNQFYRDEVVFNSNKKLNVETFRNRTKI